MKTILLVLVLLAVVTANTCTGCYTGTSGVCKSKYGVCYILDVNTGNCPAGTEPCTDTVSYYACTNNVCSVNATGTYEKKSDCDTACAIQCAGCNQGSSGQCKDSGTGVCYEYADDGNCPSGSAQCASGVTHYACNGAVCSEDLNGSFSTEADCQAACGAVCADCYIDSTGPCKNPSTNVCYELQAGLCPAGTYGCNSTVTSKYDCVSDACVVAENGAYSSQSTCEAACGGSTTKYACNSGTCSASASGAYSSQSDCEAACTSSSTKYACSGTTCSESASGSYSTLASCQASCGGSAAACTGCNSDSSGQCKNDQTGVCYAYVESTGECPPGSTQCTSQTHYTCGDAFTCSVSTTGQFSSESDCNSACAATCTGCAGSEGPCKSSYNVCYALLSDACPAGTTACSAAGNSFLNW